ncbi:protein FAM168A-like isoform X2 [Pygocentrus nattereri]|nr:protein FAM168A-like isoform X2 [Pygocentrus nattereri]XP_037402822.1 protein FAM168A-like isoform X2 [Pygocentrus nattereri]
MNPVYGPVQPGAAYANPKNVAYPGYPAGYPTTAPAYTPNVYQTGTPGYPPGKAYAHVHSNRTDGRYPRCRTLPYYNCISLSLFLSLSVFLSVGYATGAPYKVPPTQTNGAPPPYSASPNPYSTAMYPIRSAYPQQNLYTQGAYYSQPMFAQPHVIHHTTVVQPNSLPSAIYPAPVSAARPNSVAMGMLTGSTMAMSAGPLLTTPQHTQHIGTHPVTVPTYRPQGTPGYSYVPPHW